MLYFSRWKAITILAIAVIICLCAVPNFFSPQTVARWPEWAQRHVVLGLDLQGGSHILLEVDANDVRQQKLDQVRDDVRRVLRDAKIGYTGLVIRGDTVVTSGGLVGKITKVVDDDQIEVEIADGVRVRQLRQMISDVRAKGEPVKDEAS